MVLPHPLLLDMTLLVKMHTCGGSDEEPVCVCVCVCVWWWWGGGGGGGGVIMHSHPLKSCSIWRPDSSIGVVATNSS